MIIRFYSLFVMACSLLLCSCASTSVKKTWVSPDYHGQEVAPIAVLTVEQRGLLRQGMENRFVKELKRDGATAVPVYESLSLQKIEEDRDAAAASLEKMGAKTVLITRLVTSEMRARSFRAEKEQFEPVVTGFGTDAFYAPYDWYGYYTVAFQDMGTIWSTQNKHIYLETSLYNLSDGGRLWSCLSETVMNETSDGLVEMDKLAETVVGVMHKDGLLKTN